MTLLHVRHAPTRFQVLRSHNKFQGKNERLSDLMKYSLKNTTHNVDHYTEKIMKILCVIMIWTSRYN